MNSKRFLTEYKKHFVLIYKDYYPLFLVLKICIHALISYEFVPGFEGKCFISCILLNLNMVHFVKIRNSYFNCVLVKKNSQKLSKYEIDKKKCCYHHLKKGQS